MMLNEEIKLLDSKLKKDVTEITKKYIEDIGNLNRIGTYHNHRCVFEMMFSKKYAKEKCEKYLKTKNMERDECLCCCDDADMYGCKYMKTIMFNSEDNIISII